MKRGIVFFIICIACISACYAADYGTVVLPLNYIKKNNDCVLYTNNLEEIFADNLIKNLSAIKKLTAPTTDSLRTTVSTNPQIESASGQEEKIRLITKIYGVTKVIDLSIKYEIKSLNLHQDNKTLEKITIVNDNASIRLITKIKFTSDNKTIWSNVYYKNINLETVNSKDLSVVKNYYEKLAQTVIEELKQETNIKPIDYKQDTPEPPAVNNEEHEVIQVVPKTEPSKTTIRPQFQVQENISDKPVEQKKSKNKQIKQKEIKPSKPKEKNVEFDQKPSLNTKIKNTVEVKLNSATPNKEVTTEDIKTTVPQGQPAYTNIQVTPRKNSRNYTPQFNNSVNEI